MLACTVLRDSDGTGTCVLPAKPSLLATELSAHQPRAGLHISGYQGHLQPLREVSGDPGCHSLHPSQEQPRHSAGKISSSRATATLGEQRLLKPPHWREHLDPKLSGHSTLSTEARGGWRRRALFRWWMDNSPSELSASSQHLPLQSPPSSGHCDSTWSVSRGGLRNSLGEESRGRIRHTRTPGHPVWTPGWGVRGVQITGHQKCGPCLKAP